MLLSVILALARLDLDPWHEATSLAELPQRAATERLTSLIAALPDGPSADQAPETIAERLIALLPRGIDPGIGSDKPLFHADEVKKFRVGISMFVVFFVFMMVAQLLLAQWIEPSQHPLTRDDDVRTPTSITAPPQTPTKLINDDHVGSGKKVYP